MGFSSPCVRGQEAPHVLHDHHFRFHYVDGAGELGPKPGPCAFLHSAASAGEGHVLAGEPSAHDVHGFHRSPVNCCDVAVVGDSGPPCGEHLGWFRVELAMPHGFRVEERFDGEIQAAYSGEE